MPVSWDTPQSAGTRTIHEAYVNGDLVGNITESCFSKRIFVFNPNTNEEILNEAFLHGRATLNELKARMEQETEIFA